MARQVFRGMLRSIVVLAAIMLAPAVAEACRCSYEPPQKLVDQADVIFVGTLVASYGAGLFPLERNMTFEVERAWKGAPAKDLNVVGQYCGPWYKIKDPRRKRRGIRRRDGERFSFGSEPDAGLAHASKMRRKRRGMRPGEIHGI